MKIAIDVRSLVGEPSGIGAYCRNLLAGLAKLDEPHEYLLCSNKKVDVPDALAANFALVADSFSVSNLWLQVRVPGRIRAWKADVFHGTNFLAPVKLSCPSVVTVHDLASFRLPTMHSWRNNMVQRLLPKVVKSANKIIAISETTKGDIIEWFKVDPDKISVIYNAAGDNFRPIDDEQVLCAAREKWTLPKNMILFVGTLEPRKNLINLMRAFKQMIERTDMPHTLVIAGGLGWGAKRVYEAHSAMGLGKRVRFLGYVPYDDLPLLYNLADAFAYVSHYEGFGLPILEALSCNIPALISTAPALTELAQDAALTVSADEVDDISERLEKILTDQDLRAGLIQKGQKRAKDFTQETFTRQTLDVLVEAGSRK